MKVDEIYVGWVIKSLWTNTLMPVKQETCACLFYYSIGFFSFDLRLVNTNILMDSIAAT